MLHLSSHKLYIYKAVPCTTSTKLKQPLNIWKWFFIKDGVLFHIETIGTFKYPSSQNIIENESHFIKKREF